MIPTPPEKEALLKDIDWLEFLFEEFENQNSRKSKS
jgi:hypothetical protein